MSNQLDVIGFPRPNFFRRLVWRFRREKPVTVKNILQEAEAGRLEKFLSEHYPMDYTDSEWQSHLLLCRDLVKAGFLEADFTEGFQGEPQFIDNSRITISGRDYLSRLRQNDPVRRTLLWTAVYVAGVFSGPIIKLIERIV